LVPDDQLEGPQRVQDPIDELFLAASQFLFEHDQEIDVRVQTERAATVSTQRANRQGLACVLARAFHKLPYEGIHLRGVRCLSDTATAPLARFRDKIAARGSQDAGQL